jgi:type I restriction enzyme R subunit
LTPCKNPPWLRRAKASLAPGEPAAERDSFSEVVLVGRLREAIRRLNPAIPEDACEEALRKVLRVGTLDVCQ